MTKLRDEYDALADAERVIDSGEEYTFGDLRENTDDFIALGVLRGAVKVDEEEQEIYLHEDSFDYGLELESSRRGQEARPDRLELGVLGGSALGVIGSGWRLLEEGGPEYLATGAISVLAGRSALRRLGSIGAAKAANYEAGEQLDMNAYLENFDLKTVGDEEARQILDQYREEERENVPAYTAEELDEMDMEEIEQGIDGMFEDSK
mgnify:CR=1 FL=1